MRSCLCEYVYGHSEWCNHRMNIFSQLVGLSIKRHICLHMNAAGFTAAHPTNRSAVEGRPAADVMLVHHCGFRFLFGCLSFWQLEFHELAGLLKATIGHGTPSKARWDGYCSPSLSQSTYKVWLWGNYLLKLLRLGTSFCLMGPGIAVFSVAIRISSPFMAFSHGDTYTFTWMCFLVSWLPSPVRKTSTVRAYGTWQQFLTLI